MTNGCGMPCEMRVIQLRDALSLTDPDRLGSDIYYLGGRYRARRIPCDGSECGKGGFRTARICFSDGSVDAIKDQTIEDAVRSSGRIPDSYVYLIAGRPVPMDTVPPEDSEVRAMRVASGG